MNIDTILFHLGEEEQSGDMPANPSIYQTSNFIFKSVEDMQHALKHENEIPFYTRGANPTVQILQKKIAALEETEAALIFSSGSAAITAAVVSQVKAGDHVLCIMNPYSWTKKLISNTLSKFGVTSDFVDASNTQEIMDGVQTHTKLIYLESPNSWTYEMQDLDAIAQLAKKKGIRTIADNSFASPLYQKPANHGIDIVVHSATKYLNGHADVVAGVLCANNELINDIFKNEYMTFGGIISPFEAWLMIRSLRTLPLRMEKIGKNSVQVAAFLESHPKVRTLYYPHSKTFKQPDLVKKYLSDPGGLMTIDLNSDDPEKIMNFCNALKRFRLGCSWGGYESLAFPAITTMDSLNYDKKDTFVNRIRLFVGLEDPELLMEDLKNAFDKL